jgi:hypothetical protein
LDRGVVEGIVTDQSGAIVPGVKVTVISIDRNESYPTKTNNVGYYQTAELVPGRYSVHFEAQGFTSLDIINLVLGANQVLRTDAQLKVGETRQLVEVTAKPPLVESGSANFSTTLDTTMVQDIPLQGRDLQQLVYLIPGVANTAGPPGSNFGFNSQYGTFPDPTHLQGSQVAVNGGQGGTNAWYIDGALNTAVGQGETLVINPIPDAVSEFQVVTNGFSAQYGRTGGGVFNVVLKSGTNSLHGNIYEFVRNNATNARNPFTSLTSTGQLVKERELRFNNFGGTLGGPLVIPHVYNGRNKTFFFVSWDATILHLLGNARWTVPTTLEHQGDFSEDVNAVTYGLWDPYSTIGPAQDGTYARSAFGSPLVPNGCTGQFGVNPATGLTTAVNPTSSTCAFTTQLPPGRIDSVASTILNAFPLPNYSDPLSPCPYSHDLLPNGQYAKLCNNFLAMEGTSQDSNNISVKIDHQWSEKNHFFGDWLYNPGSINNYRLPWTGFTAPFGAVGFAAALPTDFDNEIITVGNTYTISPTIINEFRASYARQFINGHPGSGGYPNSISNVSGMLQLLGPSQIPFPPGDTTGPTWSVALPGGASMPFGMPSLASMVSSNDFTFSDDLTKVLGKHTLRAGYIYRLDLSGRNFQGTTFMTFSGGSFAANPVTGLGGGSGLAQFMLGAIQNNGSTYFDIGKNPYERSRYWGLYLQDDFHVSRQLTLNLGLRYDVQGTFRMRFHPSAKFCPNCLNPQTGLDGEVTYEGTPGYPMNSDIYPPNWGDLGPRFNFAWAPSADRKTVIRGGYDIIYTNASSMMASPDTASNTAGWGLDDPWVNSISPQCAVNSGQCVAWQLSSTTPKAPLAIVPVPSPFQFPADTRTQGYGAGTYYLPKAAHDPMEESWGLEIQRELPGNFGLSIGYVGTHGTHLIGDSYRNYDYVPTSDLMQDKEGIYASVPITSVYSGVTASELSQVYNTTSLPLSTLYSKFPFWAYVINQEGYDGETTYNGLNVRLTKRTSHGLNLVAAYTYSKKMANPLVGTIAAVDYDTISQAPGRNGYVGGREGTLAWSNGFVGAVYQNPDNINADRGVADDDVPQMFNLALSYQLPFGSGKQFVNQKGILNQVVGGWVLSGNFNAESGIPLAITGPCNALTCRPDLIGNPKAVPGGQNAADWINAAAFQPVFGSNQAFWAAPDVNSDLWWQYGTAGVRLPGLLSPGFWNVDTSLAKKFHLTESKYFEFRWDLFNALNHQNLGYPNTGYCLPPGPNGETNLVQQAGCSFGLITNIQTDPRAMQFALKFYW